MPKPKCVYKLLFIAVWFGWSFLLVSCNEATLVTDKLSFPEANPILSVQCLLTPGDSIWASVSALRSVADRPTYNSVGIVNLPKLSDAVVTIRNMTSQQTMTLAYTGRGGVYGNRQISSFLINPGDRYALTVTRAGYPKLSAICQVPERAATINSFSYGTPYNDGIFLRRRIEARWQGVYAAQPYNYMLAATYRLSNAQGDTATSIYYNKNITQIDNTYFYQGDAIDNSYLRTYTLLTVNVPLFNFFKMTELTNSITSSGTGDFFGAYQGIVPEYTNIEGGYGIFDGYLSTKLKVKFQ